MLIKPKSFIQCIVIVAYIYVFCTIIVFQYGFYIYHLTPYLWEKTSATVVSEDIYMVSGRGIKRYETVNQAEVEFYIDGKLHHGLVFLSSQEKYGDVIIIATLKSNPNKCIRSEWLPLSLAIKLVTFEQLFIIGIDWIIRFCKRRKEYAKGGIVNISSSK